MTQEQEQEQEQKIREGAPLLTGYSTTTGEVVAIMPVISQVPSDKLRCPNVPPTIETYVVELVIGSQQADDLRDWLCEALGPGEAQG